MPHLPYPDDEEINAEARRILDAFQTVHGRPSHIFRAMSWNSRFLRAASEVANSLMLEGSLERWTREAILVITCATQQTAYCVQGHSNGLRRHGLSEEKVRAIQNFSFTGFEDPELAIFRFAHKAAGAPKSMTEQDFTNLISLGLSKETILEVLSVIWINTAMNFIVDALGVERSPEMMKELAL